MACLWAPFLFKLLQEVSPALIKLFYSVNFKQAVAGRNGSDEEKFKAKSKAASSSVCMLLLQVKLLHIFFAINPFFVYLGIIGDLANHTSSWR